MLTLRRPIAKEVKQGAKFLDKVYPDWDTKIDTEKLDIANSNRCVFGQLYGNFSTGMVMLDHDLYRGRELGVYATPFRPNQIGRYQRLTKDWVRLIDKRQLARSA